MAITNGLATVAQYEDFTGNPVLPGRHGNVEQAIETASKWVEAHTGRQFHASTTTKYFDSVDGRTVEIDDLTTLTSIAVDTSHDGTYATTLTATQYQLLPVGGNDSVLGAVPYTEIRATSSGIFYEPDYEWRIGLVKVVGVYGWATVPTEVIRATLTLAQDFARAAEARSGGLTVDVNTGAVIGSRVPPHVITTLAPYLRMSRTAGIG